LKLPARIDVIIPALDEEATIGGVVASVAAAGAREVFVVDNGSTDRTAAYARAAGATVVLEPRRGYGAACLAGIRALVDTDVVVFLDADGSDDPTLLPALVAPILEGRADLVIGARALGAAEPGALTWPQRAGNALAARWLAVRFGLAATDLGPFRAIRRTSLEALGMRDRGMGWTVEMQLRAARSGLRYHEIAVPYRRRRAGVSKVAGTLRGTVRASLKILGLLCWHDLLASRDAQTKRETDSALGGPCSKEGRNGVRRADAGPGGR